MRLSSLRELHEVIELTPGDRIGSGRDKGKTVRLSFSPSCCCLPHMFVDATLFGWAQFEHQAFQLDKSCGVGHVGLVYLNSMCCFHPVCGVPSYVVWHHAPCLVLCQAVLRRKYGFATDPTPGFSSHEASLTTFGL